MPYSLARCVGELLNASLNRKVILASSMRPGSKGVLPNHLKRQVHLPLAFCFRRGALYCVEQIHVHNGYIYMSRFQAGPRRETMTKGKEKQWAIRWDRLLRYRMIETVALWEGRLTTNHLQDAFGIGRQQASKDINTYLTDFGPGNLEYDVKQKGYCPTKGFTPVLTLGVADEYLQMVNANGEFGAVFSVDNPVRRYTEVMVPLNRDLRPAVLRPILRAAREGKRVEICYASLKNPVPEYRVIQPHSVIFNGFRWHVRAFCEHRQEYRDFVLSRISDEPDITLKGENGAEGDVAWQTMVDVVIGPDPRLSAAQQAIIRQDYGMVKNKLTISTRGALVHYLLQQLDLVEEDGKTAPEVQQITLVNRKKISRWLFGGKKQ